MPPLNKDELQNLTIDANQKIRLLLDELGVSTIVPRGDNVIVMGLKKAYKRIATPNTGDDPMDRPSRGLILAVGPKAARTEFHTEDGAMCYELLYPGMICYFGKFEQAEIEVAGRMFYLVEAAKVKALEAKDYTIEELRELTSASY